MGNIPPLKLVGEPTKQVIQVKIQRSWHPNILVAVVTDVGVPVEDALLDIGMDARRVIIRLEYNCEESWIKSLEEVW